MTNRKKYIVAVKVVSQKGTCKYKHKVGDEWVIGYKEPDGSIGTTTPEGMCVAAFESLSSALSVLVYGGNFPWEPDPDIVTNIACRDAKNPVVFELRRLRE